MTLAKNDDRVFLAVFDSQLSLVRFLFLVFVSSELNLNQPNHSTASCHSLCANVAVMFTVEELF
jgi:hypothetical protein